MSVRLKIIACLMLWSPSLMADNTDRPNILWITSEDNAYHWLGCYGNPQVRTPRIDSLAAGGIRFTHAYSNAPVCAVARSTILNGAHAVTQGTHHMRSRYPIEERYRPYVHYLKQAGYHCTNNDKTDYNFKGNDKAIWDACSKKAHYRSRAKGQPFFAIFNLTVSHESSLFPAKIKTFYRGKVEPRIKPADVDLPPYLPDLPEIRRDLAIYHDIIGQLDQQVGRILDELKASGEADNTIVFHYADHGGILPRGKRYLKDTGVRVPMIVHLPEKWAHLSPFKSGSAPKEPVAFVDLAPTLLSLAGIETPAQMQGRAFLGAKRIEPAADEMVFLYADRFDETHSGMRRGLTDGRWKYIRRFTPHMPAAPYSFYQFQQSGWQAWRQAWKNGKLTEQHTRLWESPQRDEELFDTRNDPWEVDNLAGDPQHADQLLRMRKQLRNRMIDTRDAGIIPEAMFEDLSAGQPISRLLASRADDLPDLVDLAFTASSAAPDQLDKLSAQLKSPDPLKRFWAAHGCLVLGKSAAPAADLLKPLTKDRHAAIRITAAHALHRIGSPSIALLLAELSMDQHPHAKLLALTALHQLDSQNHISASVREKLAADPDYYIQRFIKELAH